MISMKRLSETGAPLHNKKKILSLHPGIEIWCNGSTTDFGSVCPGSNPGISTESMSRPYGRLFKQDVRRTSVIDSRAPAAAVPGCASYASKSCLSVKARFHPSWTYRKTRCSKTRCSQNIPPTLHSAPPITYALYGTLVEVTRREIYPLLCPNAIV